MAGTKLLFKCECFQNCGAFKFRGAWNVVLSLNEKQAAKGFITHSSGNHAAALALAAKIRGIPAYVVIPNNAPQCKVQNVLRYGGHVILSEPTMESRRSTAAMVVAETGAVLVHSSNDGLIIRLNARRHSENLLRKWRFSNAFNTTKYKSLTLSHIPYSGQRTISLELLEAFPDIDTIICPISGGGLISGVALAAKSINPAIRVVAAEPIGANDATLSKAGGKLVILPETNTIADGLRASLGDKIWPIVRDFVDDVITIEDKEIIEATRLCFQILKVTVEPSGATGLAAVLSRSLRENPRLKDCKNIAIILSGSNLDLDAHMERLSKL